MGKVGSRKSKLFSGPSRSSETIKYQCALCMLNTYIPDFGKKKGVQNDLSGHVTKVIGKPVNWG